MSIDAKLLDILCCPQTHTPLRELDKKHLAMVNQAIERGEVLNLDNQTVTNTLQEALITQDNKLIYPVVDGIPYLLREEAIGTQQFNSF